MTYTVYRTGQVVEMDAWSGEDTRTLINLYSDLGPKWTIIANRLGRTASSARNRWQRVTRTRRPAGIRPAQVCRKCGQLKRGHVCTGDSVRVANAHRAWNPRRGAEMGLPGSNPESEPEPELEPRSWADSEPGLGLGLELGMGLSPLGAWGAPVRQGVLSCDDDIEAIFGRFYDEALADGPSESGASTAAWSTPSTSPDPDAESPATRVASSESVSDLAAVVERISSTAALA